jgi:lambda repressor-like predicted transcriptional regulator
MSPIPLTLEIIMIPIEKNAIADELRDKTGLNVAQFARNNSLSRKTIYDAINGGGSRNVRLIIARAMNVAPSRLWTENDVETNIIDDLLYIRVQS